MKKALILITVIALFSTLQAKKMTRSLIELGPKAALYIGDDVSFGIGAEAIFNPVRNVGVRMDRDPFRRPYYLFSQPWYFARWSLPYPDA